MPPLVVRSLPLHSQDTHWYKPVSPFPEVTDVPKNALCFRQPMCEDLTRFLLAHDPVRVKREP